MKKYNIIMFTTFFPPYNFGGDGIAVSRLAHALSKSGHSVTVVHDIDAYRFLSGDSEPKEATTSTFKIIGLKSKFPTIASLLTHQLSTPTIHRAKLDKILSEDNFDIIWFHNISLIGGIGLLSFGDAAKIYEAHEHWLVCPTNVLWKYNRELCKKKNCTSCSLSYKRPPQLWRNSNYQTNCLKQVDSYIAKSEFSRKKHQEFGFSHAMDVIPCFLPDITSRDCNSSEQLSICRRPYFLFVGRLEYIKGMDHVIPLFNNFTDVDLIIIGAGAHENKLREIASTIPNVKFLGKISPDELYNFYRQAIALIVPSICYETFGIIIIEAFRAGTPVIARNIGPFKEILETARGGWLYTSDDELKEAIVEIRDRPDVRRRMAKNARNAFLKNWEETVVMNQYEKIMHDAIQNRTND